MTTVETKLTLDNAHCNISSHMIYLAHGNIVARPLFSAGRYHCSSLKRFHGRLATPDCIVIV